jgi:hypothetical protein
MPAPLCAQHVATGEGEPPKPSRALPAYCMRMPCVLDAFQWKEKSVVVLPLRESAIRAGGGMPPRECCHGSKMT